MIMKKFLSLLVLIILTASCSLAATILSADDALKLISEVIPYEGEGEIKQQESKLENGVEFYRFEIHWYGDSATYYSVSVNSNTGAMATEEIEYDYAQAMREHWESNNIDHVPLRDENTGNTVELYYTVDPEDKSLLFYGNNRFGYNVKVPDICTKVVLLPDNEDGMILESHDGKVRFRVSGGFVTDEGMLKETYDKALKAVGGENHADYFLLEDDYWVLSWEEGETSYLRRFVIKGSEAWADCEISYQIPPRIEERMYYDEVVHRSIHSLVYGEG